MEKSRLEEHIVKTLIYYEIFKHPLSSEEIFALLPQNSISRSDLKCKLEELEKAGSLVQSQGFYHRPQESEWGSERKKRERLAHRRMRVARVMAHIIKRFPFVRAIFISGDLSKGVSTPTSDIDYVIITEPNRLWICRTCLVAFKKILLFNSRKFFCLNYYVDETHLTIDERDYYVATEVAHLKPLFNIELYLRYLNANSWIREYFPNYRVFALHKGNANNRPSVIQKILEAPFRGKWADQLDGRLMQIMKQTWKQRYPEYDDNTRSRIFRCTRNESRAYVGNFGEKILSAYSNKLSEYKSV